jgi:N-acetylneuraminic acid mutarotase
LIAVDKRVKSLFVLAMAGGLMTACGGGGSGGPSVPTYSVSATAGAGGSISPSSATVDAAASTTFTVTPSSGYAISGVTGCGGTLSGNTYTTATISGSCAVTASFVAQYSVTATADTGGTISPASATVNAGGTTMLTVTASSGYVVSGVTGCGGSLSGSTYTTATINSNCAVTASFVAQYAVSATAGTGGSISPSSATVNATGTTTFTVTPNSGYVISGVTGCGGTLSGNTYTTGAINSNCAVTASFVAQYTVSATAGTGGGISPSSATVNAAGTTTFTVTPNIGYIIGSVTGCGGSLSGKTYTTGSINANCAVTASFVAMQYTVTATAGAHGSISPSTTKVDAGGTTTFTVTPNSGYAVSGVTGCGGSLAGNTYTTGSINANCAVTASFGAGFAWISGPNTASGKGIYGTLGTAAATNLPGPRDKAGTWTDSSGRLWLFGGEGNDSTGASGVLNDLWEYSPSSGQWTWVGGSNTAGALGVYGTPGVAAPGNVPGRRFGPQTWTDANGNLWLLGGWFNLGPNEHWNDLWKFSPSSGEWTWVGGSNTANAIGVYGTPGVAAAANVPGGRTAGATWTDANGNLWLFGGEGWDSAGTYGWLSDLWKYSPTSGLWTWVGGPNTTQSTGVYGTPGVAAATNIPGARAYETTWTDGSGNLWLFGGVGYDYPTTSYFYFNDLWMYSPSSGKWTWVSGSNTVNATSVFGVQGVAAATNVPGARAGAAPWTDPSGNLWLLGGYWQNANGSTQTLLNDMWEYSPSSGEWTWVGGSSTAGATGVYGTPGVAALTNMPGARVTPASWTDANNYLWLFGGWGVDSTGTVGWLNDLWKLPTQ